MKQTDNDQYYETIQLNKREFLLVTRTFEEE